MRKRQDILLGLFFVGLGCAAAFMAKDYTGASGRYPMVLGLILALLGGAVTLRALRPVAAPVFPGSSASSSDDPGEAPRLLLDAPRQMVTATIIATLYVALVVPLGFFTASALLMLAMPFALGFRRWIYSVSVAAIFLLLVSLVFTVLLKKPLPHEAVLTLLSAGD